VKNDTDWKERYVTWEMDLKFNRPHIVSTAPAGKGRRFFEKIFIKLVPLFHFLTDYYSEDI
jgi:hypothetical protein